MAIFERATSGVRRVGWRGLGAIAAALVVTSPLMGCDAVPGGSAIKDLNLSVDCAANPDAIAKQKVIQTNMVQIIMATVAGQGYQDKWRIQVFPPESDLTVSRPDGSNPGYTIHPEPLAKGDPQLVALPHGALVVQQTELHATQSPELEPQPSGSASAGPTPTIGPELEFTLSCQAPPGPMATASRRG